MDIEKIKARFSPDAYVTQYGVNEIRIDGKIYIDTQSGIINYGGDRDLSSDEARHLARLLQIAAEIADMKEADDENVDS